MKNGRFVLVNVWSGYSDILQKMMLGDAWQKGALEKSALAEHA